MTTTYSVAVSFHDSLGYIDYDAAAHEAAVHLPDERGRGLAEQYLHQSQLIRVPHQTLLDFTEERVEPLADVRSFQLALTRLWEATEVHVDWSRPVEFVKQYPTLDSLPKGGVEFTLQPQS